MWPAIGNIVPFSFSKCNHLIETTSVGHALGRTGCITHNFIMHTIALDGFDLILAVNYFDSDILQ